MPQNVVLLMMTEHKAVQHHDLPLKSGRRCPMNTCQECGLIAKLEQRIVQYYDMPPSGGLSVPCHTMWSY